MSLEVIRIPEIIEYGTNFSSRWKCAWLPILWKVQSDLFPTNSVDAALAITSVADNGEGLAEFTCSANHLLLRFDWVNVTSATVTDYEGIQQIVEVSAGNIFTLNIPFSATATGSAKKYYNNYHALIEVYGSLPSGHEFESEDPSSLTTTVKIFFDSNNIAVVDLSRIGQTLINNIFDNNIISWPNVLNFWDQTEILLKESFDSVSGVTIGTTERYACIKDGGFVTGADWSNEGTGASWTFGSDQANVSLDETGDNDSKELTQTILGDALARFSITVTFTFTHTSGTPSVRLRAVIGGTSITVQGSTSSQATLTKTVTGLTADALGVFSLEADITAGSGTDTVDIVMDDVEVCIGLANKVVNSKLDFRNGRGGNMFDYIARTTNPKAKWMTGFIRPTLFEDEYFSLSVIIEDFSSRDPYVAISQQDNSGNEIGTDLTAQIDPQGIGVYQLRIDQLGISPLAKVLKAIIVDANLFNQFVDSFPDATGWTLSASSSIAAGILQLGNDMTGEAKKAFGLTNLTEYTVEITITAVGAIGSECDLAFSNDATDLDTTSKYGSFLGSFSIVGVHTINITTNNLSPQVLFLNQPSTGAGRFVDISLIRIFESSQDTPIDFNESFALTETICIDYDQQCSSQDIYLMWLNQFGGWDFWKFTAEKDFNTDITESQRTEKNIYDNWPKSYNRQALREESRISGFKSITVRSQHLTAAQADSIGGIKTSMYVLQVKEGLFVSDNVTVLVDKNSFQRFNETDDLFTMVFNIRQTDDIATQSN